ncbi:MAG: hypothetical protein Q7U82_17465 [Gammaproteobacteria bacterium]|nr:hypothetical protein [Gammaproteobacteria bacterium]
MKRTHTSFKRSLLVSSIAFGLGVAGAVQAGDFTFTNNQVAINSTGFSQTPTLDSNGVISRVADVPKTSSLGIPGFSFGFAKNGTLTNGTYSFRVGVVIDDDNSGRRIEAVIQTVNIEVSNGGDTLTGNIPTGQSLQLIGRDDTSSLTLLVSIANPSTGGPISIDGANVSFSSDNLISRIKGAAPTFETVLNEFGSSAHYTYRIVTQQISGPETVRFGTTQASSFSALPRIQTTCTLSSHSQANEVFILNNKQLASNFSLAYAVQGQFSVVGAAGSAAAAPAAFSETCTASSGGGSSGGSSGGSTGGSSGGSTGATQAATELSTALDGISLPATGPVPESTLTAISDAFTKALTVTEQATQQINAGTLTNSAAISALEALNRTLEVASSARQRGASVTQSSVTASLDGVSDVIGALKDKGNLTSAEKSQVGSVAQTTLGSSGGLITSTSTSAEVNAIISASTDVLTKTLSAGAPLSTGLADAASALTSKAMERSLPALATSLGLTLNVGNTEQLKAQLAANPVLLDAALRHAIPLSPTTALSQASIISSLTAKGVSTQDAERIAASISSTISNPTSVGVDGQTSRTALNAISSAFGASSATIDPTTGRITVPGTTKTMSLQANGMRLVPATIPEGLSKLPDGRMLAVKSGIAVELTSAPRDVAGFAAAVEGAGFDTTFRSNGSVAIALGAGEHFSGAFAFDNVAGASGECGSIGFTTPQGSPSAEDYAFKMTCSNGIEQRVLPFVGNGIFYAAVSGQGVAVETNRDTGVIDITGIGKFKPSFFVQPLQSADQTWLNQHEVSNGISFRGGDFNGDGRTDYEMIDANGKQILYGLP